jgi:hypothetical protein
MSDMCKCRVPYIDTALHNRMIIDKQLELSYSIYRPDTCCAIEQVCTSWQCRKRIHIEGHLTELHAH